VGVALPTAAPALGRQLLHRAQPGLHATR